MTPTATTRPHARVWLAVLLVSFVFGLATSWERWGNPLIDNGREMNQPLRMLNGERLYSDIRHIYGPLSPWLHAELFHAFGPSLTVLYADGILSAIVILALLYWLARQIMDPAGAAAATLSVMWLCVFRQSGVYILPYSYNTLHGTLFGFVTLALLVVALERERKGVQARADAQARVQVHAQAHAQARMRMALFVLAGISAALTLLSKTEMGFAAEAAGVTAALLVARPSENLARGLGLAALFLGTSLGLTVAVYAAIAAQIGWSALIDDNWLLLYNIAPELKYYNSRITGFDRPFKSIGRMLIAAGKLGILVALVGAISQLIAGSDETRRRAWRWLAIAMAAFAVLSITSGLDWDKGPYLAMPFLLIGLLIVHFRGSPVLTLYSVFAFASVARMILHVRSGGAYASYLLPMSVIIFTYLWVEVFPKLFDESRVRRAARAMAMVLILANVIITAGITAYRYRTRNPAAIVTVRGTMITGSDLAQAWNEALVFIDTHTRPGDAVAVMPEGTSLDFMSGRRNPLREEITTPGFLDAAGEARAIQQLQDAHTRLILITNRVTAEFGPAVFGRDYNQRLMQWIETHYQPCAIFGPDKDPNQQIGARSFFIRAYCSPAPAPAPAL